MHTLHPTLNTNQLRFVFDLMFILHTGLLFWATLYVTYVHCAMCIYELLLKTVLPRPQFNVTVIRPT